MEDEQREVYNQTLQVLKNRLEVVISLLKDLLKPQLGIKNITLSPTYKVSRWKYGVKKSSLDEAIKDLEIWQGLADQSWFLLLRIADTQVDQALAASSGARESGSDTNTKTMVSIRAALQQNSSEPSATSAVEHLNLNPEDIKNMVVHPVPFCDGIEVATRTFSRGPPKKYILNHIQCEPSAKPQILKRNVRDLVRRLQVDDPYTFGLLNCKGFVAETVRVGSAELLSLTLVFREPPASHNPRSLREILLNTPTFTSTTRRLEIARDLARSVGYVHTFGFVHKNVRPESVLIFDCAHGGGMAGFLVGFENFRRDEGWTARKGDDVPDKNLYRHPSRQGFSPRDDYEMRHDIYSLGMCLLEIGLWGSFVEYDPTTGAHNLLQLLTTRSEKDKDLFVALARCPLPRSMGDKYAEIVETCLTCLDPDNVDFGDEKAFEDENGILVGARYIEKVLLRLGRLRM